MAQPLTENTQCQVQAEACVTLWVYFLLREPLGFTCGAVKLEILTLWSVSPLEVSVFTCLIKQVEICFVIQTISAQHLL